MNVEPQTPIRKDNKGRTQMVWIASALGLVVLSGALYFFISKLKIASAPASSPTLTLATPLHTLTFDDGSSLNVFNIGDGVVVDGDMNPKSNSLFSSDATGSYGTGNNYAHFNYTTLNEGRILTANATGSIIL
jgi:hypothetical protein